MKMKNRFLVMLAMLVCIPVFAGCAVSSSDSKTTETGISEQASAAAMPAESESSVTDTSEQASALSETSGSEQITLPDRKWSPELQAFMEEINDEHREVKKVEGDYSRYVEQEPKGYLNLTPYMVDKSTESQFDQSHLYSLEQVEEDMDLLMLALQTNYGPFYYYGGREKFLQVKEEILKECSEAEKLTGDFLLACLLDKLSFLQDAHFSIQSKSLSDYQVPCFYRETAFEKSESGYRPIYEEGDQAEQIKTVESVEGWDNLDELFKRSLSNDGEVVYYPVVYQLADSEVIKAVNLSQLIKPDDLTIHYSDETTQILTAEPYKPYVSDEEEKISYHVKQGVPVIFARNMYRSEPKSGELGKKFINYAEEFRNAPAMIVDLRTNSGGDLSCSAIWWETYTEQEVTANFLYIMKGSFQNWMAFARDANSDYYLSAETMQKTLGYRGISDYYTAAYSQPDKFVDNEELSIILTSKLTASAAEHFTEIAHNVNNTLVIGENSTGCMFGSGSDKYIELPNTHLRLTFGGSFSIYPEDPAYFQEFRGLEPDIWVPAGEAEELAVKFIERYTQEE